MDIRFAHREAFAVISRASSVLLVSHPKPDGDTLGAALAMLHACDAMGVPATLFCRDRVPRQYAHLNGAERVTTDEAVFAGGHGVLAVFDAGDLRFAGISELVPAMRPAPVVLNFDHHATNERFGAVNVLDVAASSTAEVVYDFLRENGVPIGRDTATALLTGILFDTGNFSNGATTASAMRAASDLVLAGGKMRQANDAIYRNKSLPALGLWGSALSRLKHHPELGIASTAVFLSDLEAAAIDDEHVEGISNFVNRFLDVRALLVLKELPDGMVKASFRSVDATDVAAPAQMMGGGGHKKASGAKVRGRILETPHGWTVRRA